MGHPPAQVLWLPLETLGELRVCRRSGASRVLRGGGRQLEPSQAEDPSSSKQLAALLCAPTSGCPPQGVNVVL